MLQSLQLVQLSYSHLSLIAEEYCSFSADGVEVNPAVLTEFNYNLTNIYTVIN